MSQYNKDEALRLQNQLCFPLYAAARKVVALYTPYLKPLGLTYTQYIVFLVLWEQDHITVGELGRRLYLDNGTLTPLLKKLEAAGYLNRTRDREDERVVLLTLTEQGRQLKDAATEIPLQVGSCLHLDRQDAQLLNQILHQLLGDE